MSVLLEAVQLSKRFPVKRGSRSLMQLVRPPVQPPEKARWLHAVDGVSFTIAEGESVGLVGESGCGKSTLVRMLTRLIDPTDGNILFAGRSIAVTPAHAFARTPQRAQIQMVFQDPTESLNPRFTAFDAIAEPLRLLGGRINRHALHVRVRQLASLTGLAPELLSRFPHQLSGGQKARVGIARAIALNPRLLVLDEPTSALDVSVQALILKLLAELRGKLGMSYLFVSHDLNVVRLLCDRVLVMYLGKVVESGPAQEIFERPQHPYTRALVSSVPRIDGGSGVRVRADGEPRRPIDPSPKVCRYAGRCPSQVAQCTEEAPVLGHYTDLHSVACHLVPKQEKAPAVEAPLPEAVYAS
jgi:oligopeptide/dipeptide ABC transporter ATP-binding protein